MGLTVHYSLDLGDTESPATVEARVRAMHAATRAWVERNPGTSIREVRPATEVFHCLRWVLVKVDARTTRGVEVEPLEGWCFSVNPGEDCETATFGLCRYPATVQDGARQRATRIGRGWSFATACKTQYASRHGWSHFLFCHRAVIDLVQLWRAVGVKFSISDEGDYWPDRDEVALRRALGLNNAAVAALAGKLMDARDDGTGKPRVQSPIFGHPDFERLEHEGAQRHAAALAEAGHVIQSILDGQRPRPS